MCEFPSWIVDEDEKKWWLTDKDIERHHENMAGKIFWSDFVGHSGIKKIFGKDGEHLEKFCINTPKKLIDDIRSGKMNKIMASAGTSNPTFDDDNLLHSFDDKPAIMEEDGCIKSYCDHGIEYMWDSKYCRYFISGNMKEFDMSVNLGIAKASPGRYKNLKVYEKHLKETKDDANKTNTIHRN